MSKVSELMKQPLTDRINTLLVKRTADWIAIGGTAAEVKESGRYKELGYKSYDAFRVKFAADLGVDKSCMQRYRGSYEAYIELYRKYKKKSIDLTEITNLPSRVSAEGIEVLDKISRAVSDDEFLEYLKEYQDGHIKLAKLKQIWLLVRGRRTQIDPKFYISINESREVFHPHGRIICSAANYYQNDVYADRLYLTKDEQNRLSIISFHKYESGFVIPNYVHQAWLVSEQAIQIEKSCKYGLIIFQDGICTIDRYPSRLEPAPEFIVSVLERLL